MIPVEVIAEALAAHAFPTFNIERGCWDCPCGEPVPRSANGWEKHVASVIAALPNITIVPVVQPTDTKDYSEGGDGEDFLGWEVQHGPYFISVYDQGEVQVSYDGNVEEPISAKYARDLGATLLAAARAAGGES